MAAARLGRKRLRRLVAFAAVVALTGGAGAVAWHTGTLPAIVADRFTVEKPDPPASVRGVRIVVAKVVPAFEERRFTGIVVPRFQGPLAFRVAGRIEARAIDVGDRVAAGQMVMTLALDDVRAGTRAAEADLAAAKAQGRQASAEDARQARLLANGWIAKSAYDIARAEADVARGRVDAAREALTLARNREGYATLTAPFDGIVTSVEAEAGSVVAAGQTVLTLARPGGLEVEVPVPEGQIDRLTDWAARVTLWAEGDATYPATLREVAPQADPAGRTHAARFALPEGVMADLGATATVGLTRTTGAPVATLPATAVFFANGQASVWIVPQGGDRAIAQPVAIARMGVDAATVRGVPDGARVVTLGVNRIDASLPIRVVEDRTGPEPNPSLAGQASR